MATRSVDFQNILVIHFGQLGDVILAIPAFRAIREHYPDARLTIICGKAAGPLLDDLKLADEIISVDRVALLRGKKHRSILKIFGLVGEVRRKHFDLVIDLHSLSETNILGYLSGAKSRLFSNRESRSLDFLSNVRPRPEKEDKQKHLSDYYLAVLKPLGIQTSKYDHGIEVEGGTREKFRKNFLSDLNSDELTIGYVVGAGHPSRRWPLENFAEVSRQLARSRNYRQLVFIGPEEEHEIDRIKENFGGDVRIVQGLNLYELSAAFQCLDVLVSNDTGPSHLAALVGIPIVLIIDERAPLRYLPLTRKMKVTRSGHINDISVDEVFGSVMSILDETQE